MNQITIELHSDEAELIKDLLECRIEGLEECDENYKDHQETIMCKRLIHKIDRETY